MRRGTGGEGVREGNVGRRGKREELPKRCGEEINNKIG